MRDFLALGIDPLHPEGWIVQKSLQALRRGEAILLPTVHGYVLCCDLASRKAAEALAQLAGPAGKNRSAGIGGRLLLAVPDLSTLSRYASLDDTAYRLLRGFLPGTGMFRLLARANVPRALQTKRSILMRVPSEPLLQELLQSIEALVLLLPNGAWAEHEGPRQIQEVPACIKTATTLHLLYEQERYGEDTRQATRFDLWDLTEREPTCIEIGAEEEQEAVY